MNFVTRVFGWGVSFRDEDEVSLGVFLLIFSLFFFQPYHGQRDASNLEWDSFGRTFAAAFEDDRDEDLAIA